MQPVLLAVTRARDDVQNRLLGRSKDTRAYRKKWLGRLVTAISQLTVWGLIGLNYALLMVFRPKLLPWAMIALGHVVLATQARTTPPLPCRLRRSPETDHTFAGN